MLSGATLGYIGVGALLIASLIMAMGSKKHPHLSRIALFLFLTAFVGGVVVTLFGAIGPREETMGNAMTEVPGDNIGIESSPALAIGNFDEKELKRLEQQVQKDPKDVASRERLGHLYLQLQNFEKAFQMAHEAIQLHPQSAESRVHLGMVLFAMQDSARAMDQMNQALAINPNLTEALLFKGIVELQGMGDPKAARKTWEEFLRIAPANDPGRPRVEMFLTTLEK